jgi:glycogen debranching enzyme
MALELARENPATEDMASKFFEHFVAITDAINSQGGTGLWNEEDGFFYDQLAVDGRTIPLRIRSLVGLLPLIAVEVLEDDVIDQLPGFKKRLEWFLRNRPDLADLICYMCTLERGGTCRHLLAIPSEPRLRRILKYLLDEREFLAPYGIRSLSKYHAEHPFVFTVNGREYRVKYVPGESDTGLFGGNSNWRGPVWFPINYLIIEALERYHHFYGETFRIEFPTGSRQLMNLQEVANELRLRLVRLFLRDSEGRRPIYGTDRRFSEDPHWRDLLLFHEFFHAESGRGCGADHQTGWTALIARILTDRGGH